MDSDNNTYKILSEVITSRPDKKEFAEYRNRISCLTEKYTPGYVKELLSKFGLSVDDAIKEKEVDDRELYRPLNDEIFTGPYVKILLSKFDFSLEDVSKEIVKKDFTEEDLECMSELGIEKDYEKWMATIADIKEWTDGKESWPVYSIWFQDFFSKNQQVRKFVNEDNIKKWIDGEKFVYEDGQSISKWWNGYFNGNKQVCEITKKETIVTLTPEILHEEMVDAVRYYNKKRQAAGVTCEDTMFDKNYDFLPDIEKEQLLVPADFQTINFGRIQSLEGFVRAYWGDDNEDKPITIYYGDTGTGKTRAAYFNLVSDEDWKEYSRYYLPATRLKSNVNTLVRSPGDLQQYIQTLKIVERLFIDDLSMCPFTGTLFESFVEILNHRTENDMQTVITLQMSTERWGDYLKKQGVIAPHAVDALIRRLLEFAYIVEFKKD